MDAYNKKEIDLIQQIADQNTDRKIEEIRTSFEKSNQNTDRQIEEIRVSFEKTELRFEARFDRFETKITEQLKWMNWIFGILFAAYLILKIVGKA